MKNINDTVNIRDMSIPGTHDSGAISGAMIALATLHHWSIKTQLEKGIRFLDIRLAEPSKNKNYSFVIAHAVFNFGNFDANIMSPVITFLKKILQKQFLCQ